MIEVGSQAGSVHRQREGTGLAHILTEQSSDAVDTYGRIWALSEAQRMKRDADAEAKKAAAIKGLKEFAPEYAYRYKAEIQPKIEAHIQEGANLLAKGVDPFTGVDAASVAWQKNHQSILADADHSMQTQKEIGALMQDMDGKNPDDYTADSWQAQLDWAKKSLEEKRNGGPRPPLVKQKAWTDASEFIGKNMRIFDDAHPDADPRVIEDFVTNLLQQPANQDKIAAYAQKYAELPPTEQKRITQAAQDGHREIYQQLALEDGIRYQKGKQPLDFQKEMDKAATDATSRVSYSDWQQGDKSGKAPKKGEVPKQAANAAEEVFNSRADWMTYFDRSGELPRGDRETDPSYAGRVKGLLASKIQSRMKADTQYRVDKSGTEDQKKKASSDLFVADITGDDMAAANSAANLLTGTTFAANLKIEDASVNRAPDYSTLLNLQLTTPMSVAQVKQAIVDADTGVAEDQISITEREGKKQVILSFRPGEGGKQSAARLYDNFMKETGSVYEPKHTDRTAPVSTSAPATPNSGGSLDNMFK
jgi:hypothetical protein